MAIELWPKNQEIRHDSASTVHSKSHSPLLKDICEDTNTYEKNSSSHFMAYFLLGTLIHFAGFLCSTNMIFGQYGSAVCFWVLFVMVPRMIISVHETFHYMSGDQVPFFMRYLIFSLDLYVHYDLWRKEHMLHHTHMGTLNDKNLFLLTGTPMQAFLKGFLDPEKRLYDFLSKDMDPTTLRHLLVHWATKLVTCGTEMYFFGARFWFVSFFLPYRLVVAIATFVFFYLVHNDTLLGPNPKMGVYNLDLPAPLQTLGYILWGNEVMDAVCHHAAHHTVGQWKVRTDKLHTKRADGPYNLAAKSE